MIGHWDVLFYQIQKLIDYKLAIICLTICHMSYVKYWESENLMLIINKLIILQNK